MEEEISHASTFLWITCVYNLEILCSDGHRVRKHSPLYQAVNPGGRGVMAHFQNIGAAGTMAKFGGF
jgi:hypothetical protein